MTQKGGIIETAKGARMLSFFKSKKSRSNDETQAKDKTIDVLNLMMAKIDLRFNEMSSQIQDLKLGLQEMEVRLLTKDLKDKQQYGLLHYKLHERENPRLQEEIEGVKAQLQRKRPTKEQ